MAWRGKALQCICLGALASVLSSPVPANQDIGNATLASHTRTLPAMRIVPGLEEPLVATGPTERSDDIALDAAIAAFRFASDPGSLVPLETFVTEHPRSAWRMSVLTNLGIFYYRHGYFSRAISAWDTAWNAGRDATEPRAKAIADRAVGELARMHARVGHAKELEALFAQIGDRPISGPATEMITGAREGLWMFHNEPGISYLCGPRALQSLLRAVNADEDKITAIEKERSGPHGFNLAQLAGLADEAGIEYRLVYRQAGEPIPVPSIVNWKLHHFAAIVGEKDGLYHLKDPTFASGDAWVSKDAIDTEASGYFLVPAKVAGDTVWRTARADEARRVYGMGFTSQSQPGATTPCDGGTKDGIGMCVAADKKMVVSLSLTDSPVGYEPPIGPSARVRLTYNQREASQPAAFGFFNVSPKWTLNVLSWIQDYPDSPGFGVLRYVAGGGSIDYNTGYNYYSATGEFSPERQGQAVLVRIPSIGLATSYELRSPDGSKQVFSQSDGASSYPRRFFLTKIVDPAGNALQLNYDEQLRLRTMTDASGRNTTFSYENPNDVLLVTRITDPFGRFATLAYDTSGRLSSITDVIGLVSSFTYDAGGLINAMTTPYGTSTFLYGQVDTTRFLETTDPLGYTDRLEFRHQAPGLPYADPVAPVGFNDGNRYLYYRNSFYWDKNTYPVTHSDYTKAQITHWLHSPTGQTSPIVESTKSPLERRIWRSYPGQSAGYYEGGAGTPTTIARVLDDGSTQATHFTYNVIGKPLTMTDPVGRVTRYTYDASGVDLVRVEQKTSTSVYETVANLTYNSQHLPTAYTDAAGATWTYTYNAAGQRTSATNPLGETTQYQYDSLGYLVRIVNARGNTAESRTYDAMGRLATRTDSEGHTVTFAYDAMDRLTRASYPDGTSEQYVWDRLDLVSVTDRLWRTTTYGYDANRQLISVTDELGQTTAYGYYPNGTLKSLTDANGNTTTWARDLQSRVTAKIYADGTGPVYTYEATTSRLKSITDALNQVKTFGYALDDRLASLSYTNVINPTPNVTYSWDSYLPQLASMTDGNGTTNYTYVPIGSLGALRLATADGPFGNDTVAYDYDVLGRFSGRGVGGSFEAVSYDALGRVTERSNDLGQFSQRYLGETSQLTDLTIANSPVSTHYAYGDNIGDRQLARIDSYGRNGLILSLEYDTAPENLINQIVESVSASAGGTVHDRYYGYDDIGRLTEVVDAFGAQYAYNYDPAGNLVGINAPSGSSTFSVNALNQIESRNGVPYVYDANGNLLEDDRRTYQWDAENRLVAIGYKDGYDVLTAGTETRFHYDGLDRRTGIIDTKTFGQDFRFVWCGNAICQVQTAADEVVRWIFDNGEVIPQSAYRFFYSIDHLGSVRDVLSASADGGWYASFDYDAYGQTSERGSVSPFFRYAGMFYHQTSGLHLTKYRAYDPGTGRWLSRDPIGEEGGVNLYAYVRGNPMRYTDPRGLNPVAGAIAGAEVGTAVFPGPGTVIGAGLGLLGGSLIADQFGNLIFAKPKPGSKPKGCPTGTMPIDQIPGLDKDDVHGIKDGVGAGPRDWTGIAPNGDVITGDGNGDAVNHGPYHDYLP